MLTTRAGAADRSPRIVGGSTTSIANHPWQAALVLDEAFGTNDFQGQFCGASLITPRIVLTAAHCIVGADPEDDSNLDPDDVNVVLGRTQLTAGGGQEKDVASNGIYFHGNYNPATDANDVGYIVMATLAFENAQVRQISLAGSSEQELWKPGARTVVSGWGDIREGGPSSNTLKAAVVPVISPATCADPSIIGDDYIPSVMLCAGFLEGGTDSCQGDSGGPLTTPVGSRGASGPRRLVGVVSFGFGCAQPTSPGVYARVGCLPLRGDIARHVRQIENEHGIPHDNVIGSGAGSCDETAPESRIIGGPKKKTKKKKVKFTFSANDPTATFECKVDRGFFEPCASPTKAKGRKKGKHSFLVRAIDEFGNVEATPTERKWKRKKKRKRK
jgi:trypsin